MTHSLKSNAGGPQQTVLYKVSVSLTSLCVVCCDVHVFKLSTSVNGIHCLQFFKGYSNSSVSSSVKTYLLLFKRKKIKSKLGIPGLHYLGFLFSFCKSLPSVCPPLDTTQIGACISSNQMWELSKSCQNIMPVALFFKEN